MGRTGATQGQRSTIGAATAVVPGTPGLAEALTGDWRRAALFTARYGVSETLSQTGVRPDCEVIWTFQ